MVCSLFVIPPCHKNVYSTTFISSDHLMYAFWGISNSLMANLPANNVLLASFNTNSALRPHLKPLIWLHRMAKYGIFEMCLKNEQAAAVHVTARLRNGASINCHNKIIHSEKSSWNSLCTRYYCENCLTRRLALVLAPPMTSLSTD